MKISLEHGGGIYTIHSYRDNTIYIRPADAAMNDDEQLLQLRRSCLLSATVLIGDWPPQQLSELSAEHLQAIADLQPEVLLLGSGAGMVFPSAEQRIALVRLGIGYEVMDTAAACRTFNVLASEGRNVVAALFP